MKPEYRRLEIWWVKLDPAEGQEAKKRCDPASAKDARERAPRQTRPCLVLQNDVGNQFSDVTIVVPFLEPKDYPFVVNVVPSSANGLDRERGINFSQMRVVSCRRFRTKLGVIDNSYTQQIEEAIAIELGIFGR